MLAPPPRAGRRPGVLPVVLLLAALLLPQPAASTAAQSLLGRTPNLGGTWTGPSGTLHFHFLHRFSVSEDPSRKVQNTPTFLLSAGLPARTMVGVRYATNSVLVEGFPNEWAFFGRYNPLSQEAGAPLDAALQVGFNQAAESVDGELALARRLGPVRLLAAGRGFSAYARDEGRRFAVAGGASIRLHRWLSVTGDVATLLDREDDEALAWGAGVLFQIPYTPHTLSIHVATPTTTTLQGASRGTPSASARWGFEFTVPLTLSRYFGSDAPGAPQGAAGTPEAAPNGDVVVSMTNRLQFDPNPVRIRAGQTVRWRNDSALLHTVTADPAQATNPAHVSLPEGAAPFDSGNVEPGGEFAHTFTVPGTYTYFCLPHAAAGMVGTVIVEP